MTRLWACGSCGVATENPRLHQVWHKYGEMLVFQVPQGRLAFRCLACQTLVLSPVTHDAWHAGRAQAKPRYEAGTLLE